MCKSRGSQSNRFGFSSSDESTRKLNGGMWAFSQICPARCGVSNAAIQASGETGRSWLPLAMILSITSLVKTAPPVRESHLFYHYVLVAMKLAVGVTILQLLFDTNCVSLIEAPGHAGVFSDEALCAMPYDKLWARLRLVSHRCSFAIKSQWPL